MERMKQMNSLMRQIKDRIAQFPDKVMIAESEDNYFTYRGFAEYAARVAGKLSRLGVGKGDFVTVELSRCKEYVAAAYGAWLVGAAYVPLSPDYPAERLSYIRSDCGAKATVDERFLRRIDEEQPFDSVFVSAPEDPALVIYTSGSTGKPKGVLLQHIGVADCVERYNAYMKTDSGMRIALGAPFSFVVSVTDFFTPICAGATAFIVPSDAMRDPVLLAEFIKKYQINRAFISPKMLKVFEPAGDSLKEVYTGSERVSDVYSEHFDIYVMYAQTESVGAVLAFKLDKKYSNSPIGQPIGDVRIHILDENGAPADEGELCLAVIKQSAGVRDAAVKDFVNRYGQVYLVAYYVADESVEPDDLRTAAAEKLPSYMIPAFFVRLSKLPVNANGKLDRAALIAPEAGAFKTDYAAPETDMQKAICTAFEQVLGVDRIGADDDFFSLGGDSIKCALISTQCSIYKISTADIFAGKTPRMIERLLIAKAQQKPVHRKAERVHIYPLTPTERGMYLEQKMNPDSTVYNLNVGAVIKGASIESIRQSLNAVFSAHEAFHSIYGEENGLPVRMLTDKLPEIKVKACSSYDEAIALIDDYAIPFDLNADIPVIPTLYTLPDGRIVLHLAIHHIAFDGGSAETFMNELIAGIRGEEIAVPEIDLSDLYSDSIDAKYEEGLAFYRKLFADGVPVNEMPIKGKRPKVHPLSDRLITFDCDNAALKALDDTARRYRITEFELIFAAIAMTIGKYTASEDVVLGIPTNMRPADAEKVIGMFVNTAPVRIKVPRAAAIGDYLAQSSAAVRNATYGAYLPFEDVVAEFVKQRDESRNPMFDVSVNYMWIPSIFENDGLCVEFYAPLQRMSRDIVFIIRKTNAGLRFMVQYSCELFDETVVSNIVEQVRTTLDRLANESAVTVRDALALPLKQEDELARFTVSSEADIPVTLLHELFEQNAVENADRIALIASDATFTYRELNEQANIVAHNLIKRGVGVGDSVALLLPRRSWFFSCLFGVNKAGAAFIPCDPQYPADRINHIITDSDASFIITTKEKLADYPGEKAIDIDDLLIGENTVNPGLKMSDDSLAYMIYTSGSTGKPKGVMLRHKGICNYLYPHPANLHMHFIREHVENYLSVTTISFDMSFKEHTAALCNGKTLIFTDEDQMNDPRALAELMEKYHADCINATPSRLLQYMEYEPFARQIACCKLIMSGGEGYPISLRDLLHKAAPEARIINTYGPTEITVSCNGCDITDADYITVGRPLLNYKEIIVDKFGDLAPFGVIGELYIGGVGVAAGYRNLPEKTAQVFVDYRGERMYRSGDYSKWDQDGNVMILGRLDNQVKLRGLRIELGEIEGLIAAQPHIKKVAVVIRKLNGQDNLCAYYTADTDIDVTALRETLKKSLTHYMVPTAYLQMVEMPMTANGKTDIKKLPDPVPVMLNEYVAPANEIETFFCDTFKETLKLDRVGALDDFFEIGGTSLVVTSVVIAASEKGYAITYGDIFQHKTPRALAQLLGAGDADNSARIVDFDDYDYTAINDLLSRNTIDSFLSGEQREIGNVLITGATGYMGAHLLAQYLKEEQGVACCMLRKGRYPTAKKRLENMMHYYFENRYDEEITNRVKVFDGDVTDYKYFEPLESESIQTVFNCAANVKHFSSGTDIEDINVGGAVNCIKLCRKIGARMIQFSTISVAGTTDDISKLPQSRLDEQSLYFGQDLDNKYISSKLLGERKVLEAVADGGLDGKVIRVGTLAAREADGEFQINFLTNNFVGRLRSYKMLGCFPYSMIENQICMGPIDTSCEAFLKLARTPKECCVFNAVNNHTLPLGDVIREMNKKGMNIRFTEYEDFARALHDAQLDPDKAAILSSMTAYMNPAHGKSVVMLSCESHFTTQVLARMGFFWNASNEKYVNDFINVLSGFSFFDEDNLSR